jgi:CubicO group peptidase (beta-lactamase class C family)
MKIFFRLLVFAVIFTFSAVSFAGENILVRAEMDSLLQGAIEQGLIAGGEVLVGNSGGIIFRGCYGRESGAQGASPVDKDTLFDIASLTKVVATAPSIMKLVEEGRIGLLDPVVKWFPEFAGKGKDDLLVLHLLTHTSGLRDICPSKNDSLEKLIERTADLRLEERPGERFHYADINFMILGELVRRVSGDRLDVYASKNIFEPLRMRDTGFNPDQRNIIRCAATLASDNSYRFGRVQDPTAYQFGGVAGHAGVFSTADDLSRYFRMILNGGTLDGRRILDARTVEQMTIPYFFQNGKIMRGLGWDISSPFSSPRGNSLSKYSFGHTGYSGSSVWIDPGKDIFVVLLTARLDYKRKSEFNQLRRRLSDIAVHLLDGGTGTPDFARKFE